MQASTCSTRTRTPPRRRSARARGQPLPLHRLPQHRAGRAARRAARTGEGPRMTATAGRARTRRRSAATAAARRTSASSPAAPAGPTTSRCPGCCTWPWCAARSPTRRSPASTPTAAKAAPNVVAVFTGADLADEPGRAASTPGRSRPTRSPRRTRRCAVDRVAFAGEIVAVVVARTRRRGPRRRRARRRRLRGAARPPSTSRRPPQDEVLAHPDLGTNKSRVLAVRLRRGRHRRQRRRGDREGPRPTAS